MANYVFTPSTGGAAKLKIDGSNSDYPKGVLRSDYRDNSQILKIINTSGNDQSDVIYTIDLNNDTVDVDGTTSWTDAAELAAALESVFFLASGGGSIPQPSPTGEGEFISIDGVTQWDTRPYTVDDGTNDARFKEDVFVSGELFTQQGSVNIGNVSHKSSNDRAFEVNNGDIYLKPRIKLTGIGEISEGNKEVITFNKFTKSDPQGQLQPVQDRTLDSTADATTGYNVHAILATGIGNVWVNNWYLRSSTGFDNYIVQGYKGHLDLGNITYELAPDGFPKVAGHEPFFLSDLRSNFLNGNAFSSGADIANDIQVPLNANTGYWQNDGEELTFVAFASSAFQYEAGQLFGFDYPYVLADGVNWDEINTSSKIVVNGNINLNEFNGVLQLNNNSTEYYGCRIMLEAGVYDKFEVPYKNRNSTSDPAYLYGIILDQDDNTLAYQRLYVGQNAATEGTFIINFATDVLIQNAGVYQIVIGRRKWNGSSRRAEIFHKDVNSSDGAVWVAYSSSNPALNVDDSSLVDWSTINKQNFNRIPKALIYKY